MKIGIIGPSPVPFTVGGVENLLWGLCNTINQETPHQCELIKIPSREHNFWDLIQNYYNFYTLDVSHFDAVICTKYPAWMVQHPNCIFYVQHCLRGLYDTYHFTRLPTEVNRGNAYIDHILDKMELEPNPLSLYSFFDELFALKNHEQEIPAEYFAFPGPFIRRILMYLDGFGLSKLPSWRPYYCISETVKKRTEYFPLKDAEVIALHHPSFLKNYQHGEYSHIFMVSRLDGPKRIDMLIKAMKYVKGDVKLYIAGTGPMEQELKRLAEGDERIQFLGFVNDEDVERYYANSLVIPYFPYDEDFGLITIEAMMHGKPVITTTDSGGPTEFVKNGETGFVTDLDPKQIGKKISYFVEHPEEAKRMGQNAYNRVKNITWTNTVNKILEVLEASDRKKITVTSTFSIYPPQGGGQARTFGLYRELAKACDVEIVSYRNFDQPALNQIVAAGMREISVPRELQHQRKIWDLERKAQLPLTDVAEITLGGETQAYREALKKSLNSSNFCILSHPYLYNVAKEYLNGKPFAYEAQDVEYIIKTGMLPETEIKQTLLNQIFEVEKDCCEHAEFIMTCSEEDRQRIHKLYQVSLEKIIVVPNGVDTQATLFVTPEQRRKNKEKLGLQDETIGLFMGSWHGPNLDACEMIFEIAKQCPDVKFMLMGSQCAYFKDRKDIPENVAMLGLVSEEAKNRIFGCVDFALNPMLGGSGTNLKMFDYMSAGIPIITTEFGTRGIENKDVFILADTVDEMANAVNRFAVTGMKAEKVEQARTYVKETFDWSVIAAILSDRIKEMSL